MPGRHWRGWHLDRRLGHPGASQGPRPICYASRPMHGSFRHRLASLFLAPLLVTFGVVQSAEVLHPLEEAGHGPHHEHQEEVFEPPHVHEMHCCAHMQQLDQPGQKLKATAFGEISEEFPPTLQRAEASPIFSIRDRGPPVFSGS